MSKYNGSTITDNLLNKQSGKWAQKLSDKQHNDQDYIDILYTLKKKYSLKNTLLGAVLLTKI